MTDVREQIMLRLVAICDGISSGMVVYRNRMMIAEDVRPCIVILDGEETTSELDNNKTGISPRRVTMTPEVYLLVDDDAEDVGSVINALRAQVVHAILTDATLTSYTLNSQGASYTGGTFVSENGRRVNGVMELAFALTYLLRVSELVP
ncbi:MAG: hypothetical protein ACWGQW_02740 [bacterium]